MDTTERVEALDHEIKYTSVEIKLLMIDVRALLMAAQSPLKNRTFKRNTEDKEAGKVK